MRFRTFIIPVLLLFFIVLIYGIFSTYFSTGRTNTGSTSANTAPVNAPTAPRTGTLNGTLTLVKNCPAGADPASCQPQPTDYMSRKIYIYASNRISLLQTLIPDGSGKFSATLPEGSYYADMDRQAVESIQGIPSYFDISADGTTELKISVSSGLS